MEIKTTTARPARDEVWTQVTDTEADLATAIEAVIDAYRSHQYQAAGKSRFGLQTLDITITF